MIIFVFYAVSDTPVPILAYHSQDVILVLLLKYKRIILSGSIDVVSVTVVLACTKITV